MFLSVAARLATAVAAAALVLCPAAVARSHGPSKSQIQAAVRRVEGSRNLWSTVNICNTKRYPDVIGIRAQMPSLGFNARLSMRFEVEYWSGSHHRFRLVPGSAMSVALGLSRMGLLQSGVQIGFTRHAGKLRGNVWFAWRLAGRVLGRSSHTTTKGHPDADFGDPAHYSAGACEIK